MVVNENKKGREVEPYMAIRHDQIEKEEGRGSFFFMGATLVLEPQQTNYGSSACKFDLGDNRTRSCAVRAFEKHTTGIKSAVYFIVFQGSGAPEKKNTT